MAIRLNEGYVAKLKPRGSTYIEADAVVVGFGVRVTPNGVKSFVLTYRLKGQKQRRLTIGRVEDWSITAARARAEELIGGIRRGVDPLEEEQRLVVEKRKQADAPTVADLVARYIEEHLPTKRSRSQVEDHTMIKLYILPQLGDMKVAEVTHSDITALHRKITKAGKSTRANAVKRLLTTMFNLAKRWGYRADNPTEGVVMNVETPRSRYLSPDEVGRLMRLSPSWTTARAPTSSCWRC